MASPLKLVSPIRTRFADPILIGLVYFLSQFPLLISRAIFWDDFTVFGVAPGASQQDFTDTGRPWFGLFFNAVKALGGGPALMKFAIFGAYLASGLFLNAALRRVRKLGSETRLTIVLVFLLLPFNLSRPHVTDVQYCLPVLLFYVAAWAAARSEEQPRLAWRVLAGISLVLSYGFEANLVCTAAIYLLILAQRGLQFENFRRERLLALLRSHGYLIALPLLSEIARRIFFKPRGFYVGLNTIQLKNALELPRALAKYAVYLGEQFVATAAWAFTGPLIVAGFCFAVTVFLLIRHAPRVKTSRQSSMIVCAFGALVTYILFFPFIVVAKLPSPDIWTTRYQMTYSLGLAIVFAGLIRLVPSARVRSVGTATVIAVCSLIHLHSLGDFLWDEVKQDAFISFAKSSSELREGGGFLLRDETRFLNAHHRTYRFYELTGLFAGVYGDEKRMVEYENDRVDRDVLKKLMLPPYDEVFRIREYAANEPPRALITVQAEPDLRERVSLPALLWKKWTDFGGYETEIASLISIRLSPIAAK